MQDPSVSAVYEPHPAHYGNRLSNAYWGRTPPRVRNRPRRRRTNSEGLTLDQRMDRMGRDLVEVREAMEWARKEMTRLKDHVDHQLDLRAPFAFMFNQITQDPTTEPPVADPEAPFFVQEEAEHEEPTGKGPTWGQLHCIREEEGEPAPPLMNLAGQPPGGLG